MNINKRTVLLISCALYAGLFVTPVAAAGDLKQPIVLTKDGFVPRNPTITVGETVVFTTDLGRYFWPASNDHPEHTVYPQFDPKAPVSPDGSWEFRFDRAGDWGFHDHISPYYTGTIHVVGAQGAGASAATPLNRFRIWVKGWQDILNKFITQNLFFINYKNCENPNLSRSDRIGCWEQVVIAIVQKRGLKTALNFVDRQKQKDVRFAADCHVYMHRIGEEYYWQFEKKQKIEVSTKFGMCDLGFFHGFMQEFASHNKSIRGAKQYCDMAVPLLKKSDYSNELLDQCYHGIGHGLAFYYAPQHWNAPDETIALGIADCRKYIGQSRECVNGVYGGMAAMFWGLHGFKLDYNDADPFYICKNQKQPEALGCYNMFVPVVYGEFNFDIPKIGAILKAIPDEETVRVTIEHLGSMPSYTLVPKTNDYSSVVEACRALGEPYSRYCLRGFSGAIMRIGALKQAKERAVSFCADKRLSGAESQECFDAAIRQLEYRYTKADAFAFCTSVQTQHGQVSCDAFK